MIRKRTGTARAIAASIAAVSLLAAAPRAAFAEGEGIWSQWYHEVAERESVAEIPFAVLFTLPAMIVITPIWGVQAAMDKMRGGDEDEGEDYE